MTTFSAILLGIVIGTIVVLVVFWKGYNTMYQSLVEYEEAYDELSLRYKELKRAHRM